MLQPLVPLGDLVATHGLDGWLKLNPYNLDSTTLSGGIEAVLEKDGERALHRIECTRPHRRQLLVKLAGIDTIEAAAKYVGWSLRVAEGALPSLPPGQYYEYQVVGFEVLSVNGRRIGRIKAILPTPGNDLYVIQGVDKEILFPAIREFVEKVDFASGTMTVNPPEGLLDL